jgi:phenylpropionate dioxygenase-like ring-hydroxylating dioxygenase large terminal subunit
MKPVPAAPSPPTSLTRREGRSEVDEIRAALAGACGLQQARTMPAGYYTSPEFLAIEQEELFRKQWVCLGHVGEVPSPGDYFATELVGEQLIVVRDGAGVRVLSNVCRHRGSRILQGSGNARRFTCGYHAWTYGLDGRLLAAPLMDSVAGFDKASCRLPEFPTEIWQGFIFVNLAGTAAPLGQALTGTAPFIHNYHPDERHFLFGTEETWATNWKCLVENFMEGYHLSPLHAKTLHPVTPTALCKKLPDGEAFTGYRANFNPAYPERGPYHADLEQHERRSDVFYCVFPSFVVGFCPDYTLYMCLRPLSADRVGIRWGVTGMTRDPAAPAVQNYIRMCREFCAEDQAQLERLQLGLKSRYYTSGPLAPDDFEGTIWDLTRYVARRLAGSSTTAR